MNFSFQVKIIDYLKIPEIEFSNLAEKTKYSISYYFMIASTIVCSLLSLLFKILDQKENFIISSAALVISFVSFKIVKHTKKHIYPSLFATLAIGFICQWSMYTNIQNPHITEHIWIINNLLYSFFTLHFLWGILLSILHTIGICIFYYSFYFEQINSTKSIK